MGTINPAAEDDYKAALDKQQFYEKQCRDLEESREKLRAVVADIDKAMADQFGKAFRTSASISSRSSAASLKAGQPIWP